VKRLVLLLLPLTAFAAAPVTDWSPNATYTVAWQGNVSNGEAVWDRISALELGADVLASSQYALSPSDAVHTSLHLGADWYPRFYHLTTGAAGARVDWQQTFGPDAQAPVFTVQGSVDGVPAVEVARRALLTAVDLRLGKRFGSAWRAAISQRFEQNNARAAVFDRRSSQTTLEVSRDINETTRLTVSARWRDGDVVTYAQYRRPDLLAIAKHTAALRTFREAMTAYSADARTGAARVALVHATSDETAVILAYEYAQTKGTGLRFENQTIALSFIRQY
jgi:hypothetical protein